jgi:hypothetical protein
MRRHPPGATALGGCLALRYSTPQAALFKVFHIMLHSLQHNTRGTRRLIVAQRQGLQQLAGVRPGVALSVMLQRNACITFALQ